MLTIISQGRGVTIGYLLQHVIFFTIIKWLIVLVGKHYIMIIVRAVKIYKTALTKYRKLSRRRIVYYLLQYLNIFIHLPMSETNQKIHNQDKVLPSEYYCIPLSHIQDHHIYFLALRIFLCQIHNMSYHII